MKKVLPGFALLEATMALIVLGVIASFTFPMITSLMEYEKTKRTADNREQIMRALAGYAIMNNKLPAPAKPGFSAPSKCENTKCIGIIPYKELGIPQNLAKDGYGHWYTYVVHKEMTGQAPSNFKKDSTNPAQYIMEAKNDFIHLNDVTTNIPVHQNNENPIAILLISHGPFGSGAFYEDGVEKNPTSNRYEAINAFEDLNFVTGNAEGFKHQIFWITRNQFIASYALYLLPMRESTKIAQKPHQNNEPTPKQGQQQADFSPHPSKQPPTTLRNPGANKLGGDAKK